MYSGVDKRFRHALTIDVEDYFQVSAFERQCPPESWPQREVRIEANVERLLARLDEAHTKATFFTLGWIAERYPQLIRKIHAAGHEIASHGYGHQRIGNLSPRQLRQDIRRAHHLLADLTGSAIDGYRAPSFSLSQDTPWAQDELLAAGHRYSSSINPVRHDLYGYPDAPATPFRWDNGLLELPVTTCTLAGRRIPCGGGGYFRLFPYPLFRQLLRRGISQLQSPAVFYLHPWEIDPGQPRIAGAGFKSRLRHYLNLGRTESRLAALLRDFRWQPMRDLSLLAGQLGGHPERRPPPPLRVFQAGTDQEAGISHIV